MARKQRVQLRCIYPKHRRYDYIVNNPDCNVYVTVVLDKRYDDDDVPHTWFNIRPYILIDTISGFDHETTYNINTTYPRMIPLPFTERFYIDKGVLKHVNHDNIDKDVIRYVNTAFTTIYDEMYIDNDIKFKDIDNISHVSKVLSTKIAQIINRKWLSNISKLIIPGYAEEHK